VASLAKSQKRVAEQMVSLFRFLLYDQKQSYVNSTYQPNSLSNAAKQLEQKFTLLNMELAILTSKGKCPGYDKISYAMLKNIPPTLKEMVLEVFNLTFITGTDPHIWKSATVIPIPSPKKSDRSTNSFRPISLLSCLGKIIEKMIARRLMWFITPKNNQSLNTKWHLKGPTVPWTLC